MKRKKSPRLVRRVGLPLYLSLSVSTGALAQSAAGGVVEGHVEDVVVSDQGTPAAQDPTVSVQANTAQQIEKVQSSPVAATVVTEQQLQAVQINDLQAAQKLQPSLNIKFSNVRNIAINVRGFGAASSNATDAIFGGSPVYLNGIYQPFVGQSVFQIPELVGVEVLKGPQATAGGQDNTGGVVNLTTALPSFTTQQRLEFQYGSYNMFLLKGTATGAIADSDKAAFRLSIFGEDQEGWLTSTTTDDKYNGTHNKGAIGQVLLTPIENLTALLSFNYSTVTQACCVSGFAGVVTNYANTGNAVPNNFYLRSAKIGWPVPWSWTYLSTYTTSGYGWQNTAQDNYQAAANVAYTFNGFTISSISAATEWEFHPHNGYTTIPGVSYIVGSGSQIDAKAVEEDLKISTPKGGPLDISGGTFLFWDLLVDRGKTAYGPNAGTYYGSNASALVNNTALNYLMLQAYDNPSTKEVAPYIQSIWHATSDFDITTGVRYSYNDKTSDFSQWTGSSQPLTGLTAAQQAAAITQRNNLIGPQRSWFAETHQGMVSALGTATYKFSPNSIGYVTVSQGGRAGGPNPASGNLPIAIPKTVLSERLDNYEVGVKTSWFDERLIANIAAYTMYDHNYINYVNYVQGTTVVSYLANAKLADSRGVEVDLRANPIDGLTSYISLSYDDAFYGSFTNSACPFEVTGQTTCNLTGKPLSLIPKWTVVGGFEYGQHLGSLLSPLLIDKPLIGYFGADYTWTSSFYSGTDDSRYSIINPYGLLDLHAGIKFEDNSWDLVGWAHNALNKHYFTAVAATTAGEITGTLGSLLMVGATIRAKF
jgi:iron complex outermembrane receptor protein